MAQEQERKVRDKEERQSNAETAKLATQANKISTQNKKSQSR